MALKSIAETSSIYHETSRPVQTANIGTSSVQNMNESNSAITGTAEMAAAAKVLNEQQDNTKEGGQQKTDSQVSAQRLKNAVTQANNKMRQTRTRCEFSYHDETNRVSIKVFDRETQEIIREIPPEESLDMLEKIWEIAGLLVDERR